MADLPATRRPAPPTLRSHLSLLLLAFAAAGCSGAPAASEGRDELRRSAREFLQGYEARFQELSYAATLAEWEGNTRIVEGDDGNARRIQQTGEALAAFTGAVDTIERARGLLARRELLEALQVRQLEEVLFRAAARPQTEPELVRALIAAEARQQERLFGFAFRLDGEELTPNAIDALLEQERDVERRRRVWECSKEVGRELREGLVELRGLRNATVRSLGFPDFFSYKVSEYGLSREELLDTLARLEEELRPLYRELHTWTRHELAARYGEPVPELLPAHWLPNRWGQDWSALVEVEGFDLDSVLADKEPEWIVRQAERFYTSLGFPPLPRSFWERSSLYPVAPDAGFKKNTHASAWHLDYDSDVRSLMSVEPNTRWWETTHHELGHVYYYLCYTRPEVPLLLRKGADRAYHEAIGSLMGLAATQPRFLRSLGLESAGPAPDPMRLLLKEALNYVVFLPWSAGTMTRFEAELYAEELDPARWNRRWWELVARHQGIAPPAPRGEEWCDAATKTHVNDDPAEYYDYALSYVLLFQLHDHLARTVLHQDPRDSDYYGSRATGELLRRVLSEGGCRDGHELLREITGEPLSARAMLEYFRPLEAWLREANRGRQASF